MAFKFRIDVSRCIGCRACEVACVTVNDLNPSHARCFVPYLEANETKTAHATYAPYLCHHCEEPPCVPACPTGASYKAADGRVLVDKELCIGCGMCVKACPYDARYVDPGSKKLEKCTLCDGRVQAGLAPACFDVCPADARLFEEVVEIAGRSQTVRIGNVSKPDAGHKQMKLVSEMVNPKPRLILSGRPEDLELVAAKRPPKLGFVMPAAHLAKRRRLVGARTGCGQYGGHGGNGRAARVARTKK